MSELDDAREVLTAYDELVDALRARVAELEACSRKLEAALRATREHVQDFFDQKAAALHINLPAAKALDVIDEALGHAKGDRLAVDGNRDLGG